MQVISETKLKQGAKQMNKSSSMACANPDSYRESEHEAVLAKLQSFVRESYLT